MHSQSGNRTVTQTKPLIPKLAMNLSLSDAFQFARDCAAYCASYNTYDIITLTRQNCSMTY